MLRALAFILPLALGACMTSAESDRLSQEHLNRRFAGKPLTEWILKAGHAQSRIVRADGSVIFIYGPPCPSHWHTRVIGPAGTPDSYEVTRVDVVGFCP